MTILQCKVYARLIDNEPTFYQDISIQLLPTSRILHLVKEDILFQTRYIVELHNVQKLCTISSDAEGDSALKDVVFAINLMLKRVSLSYRPLFPYSKTQIIWDEMAPKDVDSYENVKVQPPAKSSAPSSSDSTMVMRDSMSVTDIVYIEFKNQPIVIAEEKVLKTFKLVHQLKNGLFHVVSSRELHNLAESFKDFEIAMNHSELSEIFKSLFIALEKAVNYQKELRGEQFDNAAAVLTGSSSDDIKKLRQAYDRFKHPDKTPEQVQKTLRYTKELPGLIRTLRPLAGKAILSRLKLG